MKREDMIHYIKADLKDFVENYQNARNPKAREHKIQAAAEGILAMVEGFGMTPPKRLTTINDVPKDMRDFLKEKIDIEGWMVLNLPKEVEKWEE